MATALRSSNGKSSELAYGAKMTKVERYNWVTSDQPGSLQMIDKHLLLVDPTYQRPETDLKVRRMASDWSWMACGAILVASRAGHLYVFDGWHRVTAAMRRADITSLPCLVFEVSEISEEAQGFLRSNRDRKPISAVQKFNAEVIVGNPACVKIKGMAEAAGYVINKSYTKGRAICCVASMAREAEKRPEILDRVWPLLLELADGEPITEHMVCSICFIEHALTRRGGESLLRQPWRGRLVKLGREGVIRAAMKAAAYYSKGGPKVWAGGVVDALNKGVQKRLSLTSAPEPSDD